ncbi:MAG: hypothetical protein AAF551_01850 [Bacteroidota bacterium]
MPTLSIFDSVPLRQFWAIVEQPTWNSHRGTAIVEQPSWSSRPEGTTS